MGSGRGSRSAVVATLLVLLLSTGSVARTGDAARVPAQVGQVARVVRDLAPVYGAPDAAQAVVWRLYEGSQVMVMGETAAIDGAAWWQVRLWNSQDGWLEADALSFAPYPLPPPLSVRAPDAAAGGPCRPRVEPAAAAPRPIAAAGAVVAPTRLGSTPDEAGTGVALAAGTAVDVRAWTLGADGRVRYEVAAADQVGWAAPGSVTLAAADPLTRAVGGRPIVEPLRGKGMWYILDSAEHGTAPAARIAAAARANGLTHLYVEVATSRGGFWGARWLDALLPAARAAGLRVIGSVYPCLDDLAADLALASEVARYRTPDGLALDGLTADVEETLVAENVEAYGALLRQALGDNYLLVATVYPPESFFAPRYPWAALARSWNALAPMAYWRQMEQRPFTAPETAAFVQRNLTKLRALVGRDDLPVEMLGQTFDASAPRLLGPDTPTADEVTAAVRAAHEGGALGISFFDWTRATPAQWEALAGYTW